MEFLRNVNFKEIREKRPTVILIFASILSTVFIAMGSFLIWHELKEMLYPPFGHIDVRWGHIVFLSIVSLPFWLGSSLMCSVLEWVRASHAFLVLALLSILSYIGMWIYVFVDR